MSDDADPLKNADVGETHTVRESVELHTIDFEPGVYYGSDRFGRASVESVEVTENEYGDETVVVTFEGDMTKTLPRRWDTYHEPLTDGQATAERRTTWLRRLGSAAAVVVPVVAATVIAGRMMDSVAGNMTINGEPMAAPTTVEMAMVAGTVLVLAAVVFCAANGMLPPRPAGDRR